MARGDGGKRIFEDKHDHECFLHYLSDTCESHGWLIHAWVLMGNHFHLLLETPEPNLVSGMRYLMSHFSQNWNYRRQRRGHVFQGRYKAIPVSGERAPDASYFRIVADYIHLNPARAGIAGGNKGKLTDYVWSSLPHYQRGKGPQWLRMERVWQAFSLDQKSRGRAAYVEYLEKRALEAKGAVSDDAMRALRRGWYLGEDTFKDKLMNLLDEATSKLKRKKSSISGAAQSQHNEHEAENIIQRCTQAWGMQPEQAAMEALKKADERKVKIAALLRQKTSVKNLWIAERLSMGDGSRVSRLTGEFKKSKKMVKLLNEYDQLSQQVTKTPSSIG
jgi:putative transposase